MMAIDLRGRGDEVLVDGELPDAQELIKYLRNQTGTDYHRQMCKHAARYIEMAVVEQRLLERVRAIIDEGLDP